MLKKISIFIVLICFQVVAMEQENIFLKGKMEEEEAKQIPTLKELSFKKIKPQDIHKITPDLYEERLINEGSSRMIMSYLTPDVKQPYKNNTKLINKLHRVLFYDFCQNKIDLKNFVSWAENFISAQKSNEKNYYKNLLITPLEQLSVSSFTIHVTKRTESGMPGFLPSAAYVERYTIPMDLEKYMNLIQRESLSDSFRKQLSLLLGISFMNKIENQIINTTLTAPNLQKDVKERSLLNAPEWSLIFNNRFPLGIDKLRLAKIKQCLHKLMSFVKSEIKNDEIADHLNTISIVLEGLDKETDNNIQVYVIKEQ